MSTCGGTARRYDSHCVHTDAGLKKQAVAEVRVALVSCGRRDQNIRMDNDATHSIVQVGSYIIDGRYGVRWRDFLVRRRRTLLSCGRPFSISGAVYILVPTTPVWSGSVRACSPMACPSTSIFWGRVSESPPNPDLNLASPKSPILTAPAERLHDLMGVMNVLSDCSC